MTLTLDLPTDLQQALEARAQARGLSLPKYLLDLAERDAQASAPAKPQRQLCGHGKYAAPGFTVDALLQERRDETRREMAAAPSPEAGA